MAGSGPVTEVLSGQMGGVQVAEGPPVALTVPAGRLRELCAALKEHDRLKFTVLYSVSGLDLGERFQTVYHLRSPSRDEILVLRVDVSHDEPVAPTVSDIWAAADWHERECFDMFGITFDGHPDMRHLLVVDDKEGYLLRKDVAIRTVEEARSRAG